MSTIWNQLSFQFSIQLLSNLQSVRNNAQIENNIEVQIPSNNDEIIIQNELLSTPSIKSFSNTKQQTKSFKSQFEKFFQELPFQLSENCQQIQSINQDQINSTQTKKSKKSHPTKNFLATFKRSHLNAIWKHFGKNYRHSVLTKLMKKKGISMEDYQELYNVPQFRKPLNEYFKSRQIYKDLLKSRASIENKGVYLSKLYIFSESFKSKTFEYINE